jgi:hypothetical protein
VSSGTAAEADVPDCCRVNMAGKHDHTPEEERRIREAALDETIAESFPSSDPPSSLPNPDEHDTPGFEDVRENEE